MYSFVTLYIVDSSNSVLPLCDAASLSARHTAPKAGLRQLPRISTSTTPQHHTSLTSTANLSARIRRALTAWRLSAS